MPLSVKQRLELLPNPSEFVGEAIERALAVHEPKFAEELERQRLLREAEEIAEIIEKLNKAFVIEEERDEIIRRFEGIVKALQDGEWREEVPLVEAAERVLIAFQKDFNLNREWAIKKVTTVFPELGVIFSNEVPALR